LHFIYNPVYLLEICTILCIYISLKLKDIQVVVCLIFDFLVFLKCEGALVEFSAGLFLHGILSVMKRYLKVDDGQINYEIKSHKKSRKMTIRVSSAGVTVIKPVYVPAFYAEGVVLEKKDWIIEQLESIKNKPQKILSHCSEKDFDQYRDQAYEVVDSRIAYFNKFYKYDIERVTIRNQSTRWGSCSHKKNLNFNYKIALLPPELQDYIVVHELCHLAQMNHSQKFWDLVAIQIPNYKDCIKALKYY
jgi:predicted metal-dependent hydrolase